MTTLQQTEKFAWLEKRVGRVMGADAVGVEAVDERGETTGMAVFEWWSPNGVGVHIAAEGSFGAHVRPVMEWVFGLREVLWAMMEDGAPSERLAKGLGFKERGRLPKAGGDGKDIVLLALTRSEFKEGNHVR